MHPFFVTRTPHFRLFFLPIERTNRGFGNVIFHGITSFQAFFGSSFSPVVSCDNGQDKKAVFVSSSEPCRSSVESPSSAKHEAVLPFPSLRNRHRKEKSEIPRKKQRKILQMSYPHPLRTADHHPLRSPQSSAQEQKPCSRYSFWIPQSSLHPQPLPLRSVLSRSDRSRSASEANRRYRSRYLSENIS